MSDWGLGVMTLFVVLVTVYCTWRVCVDKMTDKCSTQKEFYGLACQFQIVFEMLQHEPPYNRDRHLLYATAVQEVLNRRNRGVLNDAGARLVSELSDYSEDLDFTVVVQKAFEHHLGYRWKGFEVGSAIRSVFGRKCF